ncbi:2-amino-3,7-dideoxy-D-threo-hept-6-ulosonate synthase [Nocardia transvalensis]|nr:2-amino-3,7-dideoxy-D-threo-hept-6-ulosonate synthase [Nocardia transvalensis]
MPNPGVLRRLHRLSRQGDRRHIFVALDHSFSTGPITSATEFDRLLRAVDAANADAVILHRGRAKTTVPAASGLGLILHVSGSTSLGLSADEKVAVGCVEDALRLGADALSVHLNVGSATESEQLRQIGALAGACDRWQVPLLIMSYPRGPGIVDEYDPDIVAHAVSVAVDLGADLVKTYFTGSVETMREVVATSPVPVLAAGGRGEVGLTADQFAQDVSDSGCAGIAMGRQIFQNPAPGEVVRTLVQRIHGGVAVPI